MSKNKKFRGKVEGESVTFAQLTPAGGVQMETFVPWTLVKQTVKKQIITPIDAPQDFAEEAQAEHRAKEITQATPLMRALGLAHHWQRLLDEQRMKSMDEIASAEGIDATQIRRLMRLSLLAPEIIEWFLASPNVLLEHIMRRPWPSDWNKQILMWQHFNT